MPDIRIQNKYSVRRPEPSDVGAIADFRELIRNEHTDKETGPALSAFYRWKYFQEGVHPACVRIAEDRGKLIGLVACTFKKLKIGDATVLCGELGDLFVHPDYRRQGIFSALTREACDQAQAEGAEVFCVRPNDNSFPGLVRMGFEETFRLRPMLKILNIRNVLRWKLASPLLRHLCRPAAEVLASVAFRGRPPAIPPGVGVSQVTRLDEEIDDLWGRAAKRCDVSAVRDRAYLHWRYIDNPNTYAIYVARSNAATVGYVVTRQRQSDSGLRQGYLVDVLVDPDHPALMPALVGKALEHFRVERADAVFTWVLQTSELYQALRTCGFRPYGKELHFVSRSHLGTASGSRALRTHDNWRFTMGDTDGI